MKKLKKFLAGVLTLAMAMSMMTITAFAAPVFDGTSEGSLTIHKKAYEGTPGGAASGEDDPTQVPEGAKGLNGVTFTAYKVVDEAGLDAYYSTNPSALPPLTDYVENGAIKNESSYIEGQTKWTKVTANVGGEDGVASFDNLPLGIYVVIETDSPALVTQKAAPFMVAIPMTKESGDGWLYDVHVYPKNATNASGELTLVKKGKTIGVDGETTLNNVVFVLQVQGADGRWTEVEKTVDASGQETELGVLTTKDGGMIKVSSLPNGKYRFIEKEIIVDTATGENVGYIKDGATAYEFEVTSDGFTTKTQTTPSDTLTIEVMNEKPKFDKEIKNGDDTYGDVKDYNVGDLIDYKITIGVPSKIDKMKTFYVVDTPTNLDDKIDTIKVLKSDGSEVTGCWTQAKEGEHGFKITFTPSAMTSLAGETITITYKAELLSTAEVVNGNDAKLVYSHNILPDGDDEDNPNKDDKEDVDEHEESSFATTYKLKVIKRADSASGDPLEGVTFDLYKEDASGTIAGDAAKALGLDAGKTWKQVATGLTTDENGVVTKSGLANGTYYLVETKTKDPYNLLKKPVEVTLAIDSVTQTTHHTKYTTRTETIDGVVVNVTTTKEEWTVTHTGTNNAEDNAQGIWDQTVINKKGFTLPETGGMGTFVFTFVGIAMMAAAVILFFTSKKKEAK